MIQLQFKGIQIELHFLFIGIITLFLLNDKSGISSYGIIASLMHESGHIAALCLSGYRPKTISFELSGIRLENNLSPVCFQKEIFILLAGSGVNLTVFALSLLSAGTIEKVSVFAAVHLMLGLLNLLPIASLDGGKLLILILSQYISVLSAEKIVFCIQSFLVVAFTFICVISVLSGDINFTACILCGYLVFMTFFQKQDN